MPVKGVPVGPEGGVVPDHMSSERSHRGANAKLARDFPPESESAPAARHFVVEVSGALDMETGFRLSALTSELVSNAILHARTPFTVSVALRPELIRVSVTDGSTSVPVPRRSGPDRPTGRGLRIVEALSDDWGFTRNRKGKAVWFELSRSNRSDDRFGGPAG